jgi:hypothetical protein
MKARSGDLKTNPAYHRGGLKHSTRAAYLLCCLSIKARVSRLTWPRSPLARLDYSPRERR